ncbi:VanZ family protein [Candidatus Saccharibacteria bacterium]|jgi:hypothetical protein|nr:VanZ family protein [Candidatus Saccharibacteria bacterium]
MKFYQRNWFIWLSLILFAPLGIILLWTQKKYKLFPRIALSVIFLVFFIAILPKGNGNESIKNITANNTTPSVASQSDSPSASQNEQTTKPDSTAKENKPVIEFKNVVFSNNLGVTTVNGEAINNDTKAHSFTLKVSFYDENDKLLGTAVGAVNDLNGGDMKIFSAMGTGDFSNAAKYKVQVDTMVSTESNKEIPIEFSNTIMNTNMGVTIVEGEAKNTDNKSHSFTIVVGFYDENGKLLGTAVGAVNDLSAGDTKTYSAMASGDFSNAKSVKVQVDTIVN